VDADLALPSVCATLGIHPPLDQPVITTLTGWLQGKRLLLVLDNLEQVLAISPQIAELLRQCDDVQILATSRAPLRLRAEREFPVLPFPLPPEDSGPNDAPVTEYAALQLFVDRARAVDPNFDVTGTSMKVAVKICRRVDGLPLAIELAASGVRLFSPQAILSRLDEHLPLVVAGYRDAPDRQQTLHATIAWSHDLLEPDEQLLLRRMSVFRGGWTIEATEAVVRGIVAAPDDVFNSLVRLIEHNLILRHEAADGAARFTMLETIREFGVDKLSELGEVDDAHQRHVDYLLQLFSNSDLNWQSSISPAWLRRGDAEAENLRAALDWSRAHEPERSLRLAHAVSGYWFSRGAFREAYRRLETTLAHAVGVPDDLRANALAEMGMHATTYGDVAAARADLKAALDLYRTLGDGAGVTTCIFLLGRVADWSGDREQAVELYEESLPGMRQHHVPTLSIALGNLGGVLLDLGHTERAAGVLDEGLAIAEQRGSAWAYSSILNIHGSLAMKRRNHAAARDAFQRCLVLQKELQDPRYIAQIIESSASLALEEGNASHAASLLGAASRMRESIGMPARLMSVSDIDRDIMAARDRIGGPAWEAAWSDGRAMSQAEAMDAAIAGLTGHVDANTTPRPARGS
jgi:predicted ATPase